MKRFFLLTLGVLFGVICFAQDNLIGGTKLRTYEYAVKDTNHLLLDVYIPETQNDEHACMIFAFGGGFINGARNDGQIKKLQQYYTQKGYVVVSIDYRLGLAGQKHFSVVTGIQMFRNAIEMAAEDLLSATDYILDNLLVTEDFTINPKHIVTIGSSAGAITALQADYAICNKLSYAQMLPDTFRYAGVMPFAGAIFSTNGRVKYRYSAPAPTLFCHGTSDKLVPYNKIQIANFGMFGSKHIAKQFKKNDYPFWFRRYEEVGHDVALFYMWQFDLIDEFLETYVFGQKFLQIDETYNDPTLPRFPFGNCKIKDLKSF